jgi:chromosome segregation ATPase
MNNLFHWAASSSNKKKAKASQDEVEALRRELAEIKDRTREAENKLASSKENEEAFSSRSLRDQFQALYDYKMRQLTDQNNLDDKVRQQERDIDAARDAVRRLNRIVEDVRSKKHDLESALETSRLEVQKTLRSAE